MTLSYTPAAEQTVQDVAFSHGVSPDGVRHMLEALLRGGGTMAQFSHPDFAGAGQWMQGGMTMVSDLFNNALKGRVDALCSDLSNRLAGGLIVYERPTSPTPMSGGQPSFGLQGSSDWWPSDLMYPNSVGSQNGMRYAYFAQARRLAIEEAGRVTVYDTLDHQIGGFSQAQGTGAASLLLNSQYGQVNLSSLPVVSPSGSSATMNPVNDYGQQPMPYSPAAPEAVYPAMAPVASFAGAAPVSQGLEPDVLTLIERLAELRARGILDDAEFATKKAELLARL